jgi:hypothetical protein
MQKKSRTSEMPDLELSLVVENSEDTLKVSDLSDFLCLLDAASRSAAIFDETNVGSLEQDRNVGSVANRLAFELAKAGNPFTPPWYLKSGRPSNDDLWPTRSFVPGRLLV